jgi:hypothetical protein
MAEHRLHSRLRQDLRLLRPGALRQLTFLDHLWPALQFLIFGILLPVAWWTQDAHGAALGFLVISLFGFAVELILAGRRRRVRLDQNERESELLELAARVPNGAPRVANVQEHCGCVARYRWTGEYWLREGTLSWADDCAERETVSVARG